MVTSLVPRKDCPCCGKSNNAVNGYNCKVNPVEGDLTVCISCGAILEFTNNLSVKLVPQEDMGQSYMEEAIELQAKIRQSLGLPTAERMQ